MNEEYLAKAEISAALAVFAERNADKKLSCKVSTFVGRMDEFISKLPAADARKIITGPFRIYFKGLHTSWALCPECGERFMWPNERPYTMCPYCGTVRKEERKKDDE